MNVRHSVSRLRIVLTSVVALTLGVLLMQTIASSPTSAALFCNESPIFGPTTTGGGTGTGPASPYPSAIVVSGLSGTITDVNVSLRDFTAAYPSDADLLLSAPTSTVNAVIMSDAGGGNASPSPVADMDLVLDDEAANLLPADTQLAQGTYRPVDDDNDLDDGGDDWGATAPTPSGDFALSTFDGSDPNGTWSLWVTDDVAGGGVDFETGWCLDIVTTTATEPTTTTSTTTTTPEPTTTTSTTTTSTTTSTTSTTVAPAGDCGAVALFIKAPTWTVDDQQQVRVTAKNLGTTRTRCRVTVVARRISPQNGPTAPDYPGQYVVTLNPGASALSYFYVTPPVPGTYRVTGCARAVNGSGAVNDTNPSNDCRSARRTAS